ncbi:hypothetical protein EV424DRAFT_1543815 [Suillus variegatus]|nr:hypothetical protein EV424DRAFT_1543815 [Suillus variegatus]
MRVVQPTQAELQAHLAGQAQLLMRLATVLDDNDDDLSKLASDDDLDYLSDPDADFFSCCLEGPDRELDTIFESVETPLTGWLQN